MVIKDFETWWLCCEAEWDGLMEIVFHTMDSEAPAHEWPGKAETPKTGRTISEELEFLKKQRSAKSGFMLCRYFNAAWAMSSEAYAWSVPSWGSFCDLCSEEPALEDGGEEE